MNLFKLDEAITKNNHTNCQIFKKQAKINRVLHKIRILQKLVFDGGKIYIFLINYYYNIVHKKKGFNKPIPVLI